METSTKYSLNLLDAGKGTVVAILAAAIQAIIIALNTVPLVLDWKQIGITSLAAAGAYLLKNFFSGKTATDTPAQ